MVPRRRFELLRAYAHHPLKMACLPIPPPRRSSPTKPPILWGHNFGRGGRIRTRDLRFWRPLLFHLSYTPILLDSKYPWGDSNARHAV